MKTVRIRHQTTTSLHGMPAAVIILLVLVVPGCGSDLTAHFETAFTRYQEFAESLPEAETATARDERREQLQQQAAALLQPLSTEGLDGNAAYHAGSLLLAAGRPDEALPLFRTTLSTAVSTQADSACLGAAAAALALEDPDLQTAAEMIDRVTDLSADKGVTGGYAEIVFELVEGLESADRWEETLPYLETVRDGPDSGAAPLAARWIAYQYRDAGDHERAEAAARLALKRFPDDTNLVGRMENFLLQRTVVDQPLPQLPGFHWLGVDAPPETLADLTLGRVAVLDIWAPWCGPCRRSFPFLKKLLSKYGDQGMMVVGLTRLYGYFQDEEVKVADLEERDELARIIAFVRRFDLPWPIGVSTEGDRLFTSFGVAGIPHFVIVDREGTIRAMHMGETPAIQEQIETLVVELLTS